MVELSNSSCHSCAMPLDVPDFKGPADDYCRYCTDESGNLQSREDIQKAIAQWFRTWQPDVGEQKALVRAEVYMNAMPAWAD